MKPLELDENVWLLICVLLNFVLCGAIINKSALVQGERLKGLCLIYAADRNVMFKKSTALKPATEHLKESKDKHFSKHDSSKSKNSALCMHQIHGL